MRLAPAAASFMFMIDARRVFLPIAWRLSRWDNCKRQGFAMQDFPRYMFG